MKRPVMAIALLGCVVAGSRAAEAKIFDLHASLRGGGMFGQGTVKTSKDPGAAADFFEQVSGAAGGFEIGAELLGLSTSINFTQVFGSGTLTQFLLGFDGEFGIDGLREPKTFLRLGLMGGLALGTHSRVNPPLDDAQVSDKGVVVEGIAAIDYDLVKYFSVGLEMVGGYHYFLAGPVNAPDTKSTGTQIMVFLTLRAHFDPFK